MPSPLLLLPPGLGDYPFPLFSLGIFWPLSAHARKLADAAQKAGTVSTAEPALQCMVVGEGREKMNIRRDSARGQTRGTLLRPPYNWNTRCADGAAREPLCNCLIGRASLASCGNVVNLLSGAGTFDYPGGELGDLILVWRGTCA